MTKSLSKVNSASLKVLYTLQLLFDRDLSMPDLIKYYELYHNEYNSNFVMSKYINTCRYCGINIKKINNKYKIVNFPIGIKFSSSELSLFNELKNCCEKIKLHHLSEHMQSILDKINKYLERPISPVSTSAIKDSRIKNFEKACILSQKIKVIFNDDKSLQCEPIDITFGEDSVILKVFDGSNSKDLSYDLEKLFALFKLESKKIEYQNKPFDLISLLKSINRVYEKDFRDRKIIFSMDYSSLTERDCYLDSEVVEYMLRSIMDIFSRFANLGKCYLNIGHPPMDFLKTREFAANDFFDTKKYVLFEAKIADLVFSKDELDNIFDTYYKGATKRPIGLRASLNLLKIYIFQYFFFAETF